MDEPKPLHSDVILTSNDYALERSAKNSKTKRSAIRNVSCGDAAQRPLWGPGESPLPLVVVSRKRPCLHPTLRILPMVHTDFKFTIIV